MSFISNKKFSEKLNRFNVEEFQSISSISLFFYSKNPSTLVLGSSALNIISRKLPKILSKKLSKKRKGRTESIGCSVLFHKKESIDFFIYLSLFVFPNIQNFKGFSFEVISKETPSVVILLDDLLVFPELNKELDKFYGLGGLKLVLNFKSLNHIKTFLTLYNFPFKDDSIRY